VIYFYGLLLLLPPLVLPLQPLLLLLPRATLRLMLPTLTGILDGVLPSVGCTAMRARSTRDALSVLTSRLRGLRPPQLPIAVKAVVPADAALALTDPFLPVRARLLTY
jgi:hypothetical protein